MPITVSSLTKNTDVNIGFIHGWGMNSGAFTQLIKTLQSQLKQRSTNANLRFICYTISLPGHGEKHELVPNSFDLAGIAHSINPEVKENTILIGWSLGGLLAQYLASEHHPNVIGLMTIATTPKFQMTNDWPGIKPEVLAMFMQQLKQNHHKTLSRFLAIQMMGVENAKALIKEITTAINIYPAPNIIALFHGLKILQDADIRQDIKNIKIPTLRTYGRLDSLVPYQAINYIQHLQPASRHLIFKHASHAPFLTNADEFSKHIIDFIYDVCNSTY
ncbi:MAG: pimeloyl-[acyl-carrier protein] methyl ester esterase [Glaciecola sp.]|jgi:pimeloyl-[acyl-carrier protein] methyl ester esterase